ncbi:unnamed protein product [Durusdinium trenchii]|uniref:Uncharacterized protein n=1 Tax=Durusdinium trenchii TaxID=1381693 RepID=A0ABP0KZV3_9DINO
MAASPIHKNWAFAPSAALLGSLGPISRSRVCDLVNNDPDRPLPAPLRVQQRGIQGCQEIIKGILDGVASDGANKKIFVVDMLPNRFNEWGRSIAELQKEQLRTNQGHEYFFTAYYCDEESKELQSLGSEIAGGFMIPSAVVDAFKNASDTSNLNALKEKVNTFNKKYEGALEVRPSQSEPETTSTPAEASARTLCTPSFKDGDRPIDIEQTRMPSEVLSIEQFESRIELLAKGAATCDPKIQVCVTRGHEIWLQNTTDTDREVKAGELFGLGLANATETPIGLARSVAAKAIPWIVDDDLQILVMCGSNGKRPMSLADLVCHVTRTSGVTSLNLVEHEMTQKPEENGTAPVFRYNAKPKPKVSTVEPSDPPTNTDFMAMRSTWLGSVLKNNFTKLPKSNMASTLWEVKIESGVPSKIMALKPKFWLVCRLSIAAKHAVKLSVN